jgi:hypothetical protein
MKKLKQYRVLLGASLPCTAHITVDALNEEEARETAENQFAKADWSGPDSGNIPSGCDVEVLSVEKLP